MPRAARGPGLCGGCEVEIDRTPGVAILAEGLDSGFAALPYEGVGRSLVGALKFSRLLIAADLGAALIASRASLDQVDVTIVPVPGSPLRTMKRGFDPALEIALSLGGLTGFDVAPVLGRRDLRRQRGRPRGRRIADPPRVRALADPPRTVLLVDDVSTTGATMSSCAAALRAAGSAAVHGVSVAAVRPSRGPV